MQTILPSFLYLWRGGWWCWSSSQAPFSNLLSLRVDLKRETCSL